MLSWLFSQNKSYKLIQIKNKCLANQPYIVLKAINNHYFVRIPNLLTRDCDNQLNKVIFNERKFEQIINMG